MTENKVLRRIFEQNNKRDEVTRHTRKLHCQSKFVHFFMHSIIGVNIKVDETGSACSKHWCDDTF
jgi:hypothetical protein